MWRKEVWQILTFASISEEHSDSLRRENMTGDWRKVELELSRIPFDPDRIKSANIVLFGAAMNGAWALHSMLAEGYRVAAFADNDFERFQKCGGGMRGFQ